jgi:hypothetical protein
MKTISETIYWTMQILFAIMLIGVLTSSVLFLAGVSINEVQEVFKRKTSTQGEIEKTFSCDTTQNTEKETR